MHSKGAWLMGQRLTAAPSSPPASALGCPAGARLAAAAAATAGPLRARPALSASSNSSSRSEPDASSNPSPAPPSSTAHPTELLCISGSLGAVLCASHCTQRCIRGWCMQPMHVCKVVAHPWRPAWPAASWRRRRRCDRWRSSGAPPPPGRSPCTCSARVRKPPSSRTPLKHLQKSSRRRLPGPASGPCNGCGNHAPQQRHLLFKRHAAAQHCSACVPCAQLLQQAE